MAMAKIRAPNRDIMAHKGEQDEQQSYPPQYLYKKLIGVQQVKRSNYPLSIFLSI
jgi:hypothetical protein